MFVDTLTAEGTAAGVDFRASRRSKGLRTAERFASVLPFVSTRRFQSGQLETPGRPGWS
jgi:hypothetical protein